MPSNGSKTSGLYNGADMKRTKAGEIKPKEVETRIKSLELIDRRRRQIVEGALRVFTAKGFDQATVREIANEAGLTMGSLYNYIRSKEDIIYIVYDYVTQQLRDEMTAAIAGIENPEERLKAAMWQNLNAVNQYEDIIKFLYQESTKLDKPSLVNVLARETEYIILFENLLRDYFAGKKIDQTRLRIAADLLSYIPVIMTLRRWSLKRRFDSMEEVMRGILDFVLQGIEFIPRIFQEDTPEGEKQDDKTQQKVAD
jgi:AcrR family transcriptional regulator